jgi:hypothetical protein
VARTQLTRICAHARTRLRLTWHEAVSLHEGTTSPHTLLLSDATRQYPDGVSSPGSAFVLNGQNQQPIHATAIHVDHFKAQAAEVKQIAD